jgi:molybdopterin molybdotransferase
MPEFLDLHSVNEALETFLSGLPKPGGTPAVSIPTVHSLGRILAESIRSPEYLPPFDRSTVDGYAVRAADTFGAREAMPAYLHVVGEVLMGEVSTLAVNEGEAVVVHTGGMIPAGADAVVMLEDTQQVAGAEIEVTKPAAVGLNILKKGEDVTEGDLVFESGKRIRAQEIGGLMALGIASIQVVEKPRVGIISTGDELIDVEQPLEPGKVRDINSFTLSALVERAGGDPVRYGIIPDHIGTLREVVEQAHQQHEMVIITAGSSVSERDQTAAIIDSLGEPGVLVHGVTLKPGKPTILGIVNGKPLIGLPGNPVSALVVAGIFVLPALRWALGIQQDQWLATARASLSENVASETGRTDYLPVALRRVGENLLADPVYGRSNLIFTLVRADGLVIVPAASTGFEKGTTVDVIPFE